MVFAVFRRTAGNNSLEMMVQRGWIRSKPNLKLLEIFLKSAEPFGKRETRSLNHLRPIFSRKVGLYTIHNNIGINIII